MPTDGADAPSLFRLIATVGGPILLGLVIAWVLLRKRGKPGGAPDVANPEYRAPPHPPGQGPSDV